MAGSTQPGGDMVEDRVAPITRSQLRAATAFLFDAYCSDPAFAQLYGLTRADELGGVLPIFHAIRETVAAIPDTTLGCHRAGKLVGVVTYCPDLRLPLRFLLARVPVRTIVAHLRHAWIRWRCRPRLSSTAMSRWRGYVRLLRAQPPKLPCHHIMALAVDESARGSGVARRLLAAVESDRRWPRIECIQVETWDLAKVAIYERLGFSTTAHAISGGVQCWTMVRPLGPPSAPPGRVSGLSIRSRPDGRPWS